MWNPVILSATLSYPLVRGGYDGKVKLFNAQSGLCFVTFAEHTAAVQDICFTPQGRPKTRGSKSGVSEGCVGKVEMFDDDDDVDDDGALETLTPISLRLKTKFSG